MNSSQYNYQIINCIFFFCPSKKETKKLSAALLIASTNFSFTDFCKAALRKNLRDAKNVEPAINNAMPNIYFPNWNVNVFITKTLKTPI